MRDWTEIGFSSIYSLLGKLRDRELIAETSEQRGGATARKVYAATPAGQTECARAAEAALAEVRPSYPALLVGLANQAAVPTDKLAAALTRRAAALTERISSIRAAADAQSNAPRFVRAIFDHALGQLAAEQNWLATYRTELIGDSPRMVTYDVKRELKDLYAPRHTTWALIDVPEQQFLAIDGTGNPNIAAEYATAVEALYAVAYTLKFATKEQGGRDFVVAPLEGLWWADDPAAFTARAKDTWHWTMLISQPDWITETVIDAAKQTALNKKKLQAIDHVRHMALHEGQCAQALHVGPYDDEGPLLAELHEAYLAANRLDYAGLHHEVYLGDPRRADPAKLKTVLRQPVRPADKN